MSDAVLDRYKEALRRGHVAVMKGRPKEAISHYRQAASLAPDRPLPFTSMGSIFLRMQQPREAVRCYDEALMRAPDDIDAMRGKAQVLETEGRHAEASALLGRANLLGAQRVRAPGPPRQADPRTAALERHIQAASHARAMGDIRTATQAYLAAAKGYAAIDDFDVAIDACLSALEAQPGHIDVHFSMAMLYLRRGWVERGVERMQLIHRRLDIDDDPRRRAALGALARDHLTLSPELERLATAVS